MKTKWIIGMLVAMAVAFQASAADAKWLTDYAKAQETAKKENKFILLDFTGSDFCLPCQSLKKTVFGSKEFDKYAKEKLVLVEVDFPARKKQSAELKKHNEELQVKFKAELFPTVMIVNSEGKELGRLVGYEDEKPAEYIAKLEKFLAKK